ncbi:hypothetical protein [Methylobacterium sp. Leaf117]|uniref:hypothetical protein n=1 Tax=Methylobacterium sp. Leaf117 TaxID=1736260 RepID=UPI000701E088|nr:hypothetical protein [Methylobacterium sp. Leaf117]KQP92961.1 hypothetical protein ASF57_22655 [Methylobacterium sp. Leaf117]
MTEYKTYTAARLAYLTTKFATAAAYFEFINSRDERPNVVAGNLPGDAGICWTNEERAEQRYLDARDAQRVARCEMEAAYADLPTDEEVAHGEDHREPCERESFDGHAQNDAGEYLGVH